MRVLDLGGTPSYWESAPTKPLAVTTVNLARLEGTDTVYAVQGDACDPPREIKGPYDLVVSNSLIEHVGGHSQRARLADVIHRHADRHWVQTPYRYFPIEPHWMFPGIHFLPFAARVRLTEVWRFGNRHTNNRQTAINSVNEVDLIGKTQMQDYYPSSEIWTERMFGLTKSLVAIRT
ncbi:class I SAM-dependent methyltransferase [Rhodococcus opacus]|uniref:class I SAM-dependent methyltransferase n=1 Tax=Rhodococcus opacus TaxID=37919 RepID=UPI001FF4CC5F|nr:class I SAM-dependent methyltransferase [Rhodococcus opacus]UOT05842.1 class I SAM-dependent methyltransferase [Rhodococcus opacus]